jgi:hypothetical protein
MKFYWLLIGTLAVWRVTHLLQAEDGPWDLVVRLRQAVGNGFWGRLLDCFHCLSVWIAAPAAWLLAQEWTERFFLWLALSGGAALLEQLTRQEAPSPPALYYEDKETDDVMLREPEGAVPGDRTESSSD